MIDSVIGETPVLRRALGAGYTAVVTLHSTSIRHEIIRVIFTA